MSYAPAQYSKICTAVIITTARCIHVSSSLMSYNAPAQYSKICTAVNITTARSSKVLYVALAVVTSENSVAGI